MTDYRALCAELTDALNNLHALVWGECPRLLDEDRGGSGFLDLEIEETLTTARAALTQPEPVAPTDMADALTAPTLMERAMAGDAIAAKQFLYEANFTDEHGQWLPQYQPISETTND